MINMFDSSNLILHKINPHPRDKFIEFDEPRHKYTYTNGQNTTTNRFGVQVNKHEFKISSTSFVKKYFEKFDSDKIIENMMNSPYWEKNKYYGMVRHLNNEINSKNKIKEYIKNYWNKLGKDATTKGTHLHECIEYFYNDFFIEEYPPEFTMFLDFHNEHKEYNRYRTEWVIYDLDYDIPGTIDMVYEKDGKFVICDWKRSKDIKMFPYKNKRGKSPIEHIPDCNFYHYSLQVNLYKYILEKNYDIEISDMWIVNIHPNNEFYEKYIIDDYQKEIHSMLQENKNSNNTLNTL